MADSIIVGQFVGSSRTGGGRCLCSPLTNVFICVALGAGVGAGVLVSRYFGAKRVWQNENHCVYITDFTFTSEHHPGVFGFAFLMR